MRIELAWVGADGSVSLRQLELPAGTTLGAALAAIDDATLRDGLAAGRLSAAVFGQVRRPDEPLFDGDRIELVEGLHVDPKIARQRRVEVRRRQRAAGSKQGGGTP